MALFTDSVPREQYEDMRAQRDGWQQRYDTLFAEYAKLRPMQSPVNPMKIVPPKLDTATETLEALEQSTTDPRIMTAVTKLLEEKPDMGATAAFREARKMLEIATGRRDAPSIGPALR